MECLYSNNIFPVLIPFKPTFHKAACWINFMVSDKRWHQIKWHYKTYIYRISTFIFGNRNMMPYSDRERFLLNGPMAPSSKFQWAIQKINGPFHKPNGPSFTCIFRFWKLCNWLSLYFSCQLSYTLNKTFYFHLSKASAKVFPKPVYIYGVRTFHFRFQ